jgi:SAM-dependent methyltransferase
MSDFDANTYRDGSLAGWEAAAPGWTRRQEAIRGLGMGVSKWMLEATSPQPGERVLELAGGLGETGMRAAEMVGPRGGVIVSDQAEGMLAGARARAQELGLSNVEFKILGGEWIDLPLASVDVVLCRWGYMLMADPGAALGETRRVLRPEGRLGLAVWDGLEHNPWALLASMELIERDLASPPTPGAPGPFALGDRDRLRELIAGAGFAEIDVQAVDVAHRHDSFEVYWETTLDISHQFHDAVLSRPEPEIAEIRAGLQKRLQPFVQADGTLVIPGRTLVGFAVA